MFLLGTRLGLGPDSRVLDIASGRGGPAVLLASEFGCTWHGIEISPDFHAVAVERAAEAGLGDRLSFDLADAATAAHEPESYDAALCLGASFVYGSLADTVDALAPAVRPGGHVVVGEPFWRRVPLPDDYDDRHEPWTTLEEPFESSRPQASRSSRSSRPRRTTGIATRRCTGRRSSGGSRPLPATRTRRRSGRDTSARSGTICATSADHLGWAIFVGWKRP